MIASTCPLIRAALRAWSATPTLAVPIQRNSAQTIIPFIAGSVHCLFRGNNLRARPNCVHQPVQIGKVHQNGTWWPIYAFRVRSVFSQTLVSSRAHSILVLMAIACNKGRPGGVHFAHSKLQQRSKIRSVVNQLDKLEHPRCTSYSVNLFLKCSTQSTSCMNAVFGYSSDWSLNNHILSKWNTLYVCAEDQFETGTKKQQR